MGRPVTAGPISRVGLGDADDFTDGRRRYEGRIAGVEGVDVLLEVEGKAQRIAIGDIDRARLVPEI